MTERWILVDTSVWVRYLRRGAEPSLAARVRHWLSEDRAATTSLARTELLTGTRTEREFDQLSETLAAPRQLPVDESVWLDASKNGFLLRRSGVIIPTTDLIIATVAQGSGAELLHFV